MSTERIEIPASQEVIAAWQEHFQERQGAEGLTAVELAKIAGVAESTMRRKLRDNINEYEVGVGYRVNETGKPFTTRVYKLKQKPRKK